MGIYPDIVFSTPDGRPLSAEGASYKDEIIITRSRPGVTTARRYKLVDEVVERSDCFCCSCGDREGSDMACRNHGHGLAGERPCEVHNMPGKPDEDGVMPESVQKARNRL